MLTKVVIGLGSNKGNRINYLRKTLKCISDSENMLHLTFSRFYETEPWGFKNQNNFINCIFIGLYRADAEKLRIEIKNIEQKVGRKISAKWHPREIDIDILFFGNKIIHKKTLIIPHPFLTQRNFVLKPLSDLIPNFIHPVYKKSILNLYNSSSDSSKVMLYNFNKLYSN